MPYFTKTQNTTTPNITPKESPSNNEQFNTKSKGKRSRKPMKNRKQSRIEEASIQTRLVTDKTTIEQSNRN